MSKAVSDYVDTDCGGRGGGRASSGISIACTGELALWGKCLKSAGCGRGCDRMSCMCEDV